MLLFGNRSSTAMHSAMLNFQQLSLQCDIIVLQILDLGVQLHNFESASL